MGSISYWQAHVPARGPATPLMGEHSADVAIIGAGVTGAAAALSLARAGMRVTVIEARRVADGASGRNGGFLLGGTAELYVDAVARYGEQTARRIWALSEANRALAATVANELAEANIDCGYRVQGSLRLASSEDELRRIAASTEMLRQSGFAAEDVRHDMLPSRLKASYVGGAFHEHDGEIQPARFVVGMMTLAQRAGALLYEESAVRAIDAVADAYVVRTDGGSVRASWLILATNAWLGDVGRFLNVPSFAHVIQPTRGQMLVTEPVASFICACPCYAHEGYQYWRQLPDGRVVVGGWRDTSVETEYISDETPAEPVQGNLDGFVRETLGLHDVAIGERWAGVMAFTPDGLPLVGRLPNLDRCLVAGGYTGHGNGYAIACAQALATVVQQPNDVPEALQLFNPGRYLFPPGKTGHRAADASSGAEVGVRTADGARTTES